MATEAESVVRDRRWAQWAPLSGIVFVVLFVAGFFVLNLPDSDDPLLKIKAFYDDGGNRAQIIVAGYLLTLSAVFFFWFLSSLRARLLPVEGQPGRLTSIVFGSGLVFSALLLAATGCFIFIAGEITFGDVNHISPELERVLPDLGFALLLIGGAFAAIAMVDAASVLIIRTGVLPKWIGWFGFVAAVGLLFAGYFIPMVLLLLWILFVSVALLRGSGIEMIEPHPPAPSPGAPGPAL
jgi:hypothetical protein